MSTTMNAAAHLGQNYTEFLIAHKNTNFDALKTLLDITQKLILDQNSEILNVSKIEWHFTPWRSTLLYDKSNQVGESQGSRLLRLSSLSGKDTEHSEANEKQKQLSASSGVEVIVSDFGFWVGAVGISFLLSPFARANAVFTSVGL